MSIWAITSYFNPKRFSSRYRNFLTFRRALKIPLVTVEWSQAQDFQLRSDDSEIVLQVSGGDLLWQKERLLNLAIAVLPRSCDIVVWLDCDILFEDEAWVAELEAAIAENLIVQLFSEVVHQDPAAPQSPFLVRQSLAAARATMDDAELRRRVRSGAFDGDLAAKDERGEWARLGARPTTGHAWAATRALLDEHRLYDGCVCGTGDMAIALAAMGKCDLFSDSFPLNRHQKRHYERWATPFAAAVGGKVGFLPIRIHHLFHGLLLNRQYHARLQWLAESDFDPESDLLLDGQGLWKWRTKDLFRDSWMERYFAQRSEDEGIHASGT